MQTNPGGVGYPSPFIQLFIFLYFHEGKFHVMILQFN